MKELNLNVNGMSCCGCENRIVNAVKNIAGVENVIANHENGTVTVIMAEEIKENVIEEKIEDLGFEVVKEK